MGFDFKDIAAWGLAGLPKQIFESDKFRQTSSKIGKVIPNEFSKNQYLQNIPIVNWISSGLGATDAAATAYGDTGSTSKAWEAGTAGTFGKKRDPGQYSDTGERANWSSQEAMQGMIGNQVGGIGNFFGRIFGTEGSQGNQAGQYSNLVGGVTGMIDQAIQPKKEPYDPYASSAVSNQANSEPVYYIDQNYNPETGETIGATNNNSGSLINSNTMGSIMSILMNLLSKK